MSKKEKINLISFTLLSGFCFAMYFSFIFYDMYMEQAFWSKISIFFDPQDRFNDFKHALLNPNIVDFEPYEHSGHSMINGYFPFTYIFFRPLIFISEKWGLAIFFITTTFGLVYANYKFLVCTSSTKIETLQNVFIFSFLTYPFLFTIDRANIEGWILLMYIGFLIAYEREKYNLAAIIIGIAASIKFYPGMLALFFLKDKKYREFTLFVAFTIAVTAMSLFLFKGDFAENIHGLIFNTRVGELAFAIGFKGSASSLSEMLKLSAEHFENPINMFGESAYMVGVRHSSSLLGFVKSIMLTLHFEDVVSTNAVFYWYKISGLVVGSLSLIYLLKFEDEKWKISMILASYFVLFIYTSFAYKLLVFFVPIWLFINSNEKSQNDFIYSVLLALLMTPKHYLISVSENHTDSAAILNPIIIMIICIIIVSQNQKLKSFKISHIKIKKLFNSN